LQDEAISVYSCGAVDDQPGNH